MKKLCCVLIGLLSVLLIVSCSLNEELEEIKPAEEIDKTVVMLDFSVGTVSKGIMGFEDGNAFLQMRGGYDVSNPPASGGFWMSAASMQCLPLIPALKENKVSKIDKDEELYMFGYKVVLDTVEKNDDGIFFRYYMIDKALKDPNDSSKPQKIGQIDYYYEFKTAEHPHGRFSYREIITPFFNYQKAGDNIFVFELTDAELENNSGKVEFTQKDNFNLFDFYLKENHEGETATTYSKCILYKYDLVMNYSEKKTFATTFNREDWAEEDVSIESEYYMSGVQALNNKQADLNFALGLISDYMNNIDNFSKTFTSFTEFNKNKIDGKGVPAKSLKGFCSTFGYDLSGSEPKGAMIYHSESDARITESNYKAKRGAEQGGLSEFVDAFGYKNGSFEEFIKEHLKNCGLTDKEASDLFSSQTAK